MHAGNAEPDCLPDGRSQDHCCQQDKCSRPFLRPEAGLFKQQIDPVKSRRIRCCDSSVYPSAHFLCSRMIRMSSGSVLMFASLVDVLLWNSYPLKESSDSGGTMPRRIVADVAIG